MAGTGGTDGRRSKTVVNAFQILEHLRERDGATLTELSDAFGKAKSTVHRYVSTLEHLGYVVREDGVYYPSLQFLDFAEYARNRKPAYVLAKQKVEELAAETEERVQFLVEEHGKGVYVYRSTGSHAVRTDPGIGKTVHLHTIAAGKAILAHLPRRRVEAILDRHGLPARTEHTITDREVLFEALTEIRECGYSLNRQESVEGLHAVGVPIVGPTDRAIGALSISGPSHRMKGEWFERELPDHLLGLSNEIELNVIHA